MARKPADDVIAQYQLAKNMRSPHEADWRIASAHVLPRHYSAWQNEGPPQPMAPGAPQLRRVAYDSTGALALPKYVAVLERMATPHQTMWHNVMASDRSLMRIYRVRQYFEELNRMLMTMRYQYRANFRRSSLETYTQLGTYGTGPMYLGQRRPNALSKELGFIYKSCPLKDVFIFLNDEGEVDTVFRRFWLNFRQFKQKWPNAPVPPCFEAEAKSSSPREDVYKEFLHVVCPRTDLDPEALDARRHPIVASYICVADKIYVGDEEGFRSMPYLTPRTETESGEAYGFSPAVRAIPALGSASAMKKTILRQGQKAVDPVLLAHDDGILNGPVDLRPGAINYGGIDRQGRQLIKELQTGNLNIGVDLLAEERKDINDSFFVTLFQILMETPEMTAAEVYERVAERMTLLAPTMGALQTEYLGPGIDREIDLLIEMGKIATNPRMPGLQMPPELIEAQGDYQIVYTSPMAKAMYAEEIGGFQRTVQMAMDLAKQTGDNSHLDHFEFDVAIPEIADYQAVPSRWMKDPTKMEQQRAARTEDADASQLIENIGGIAGAAKVAGELQGAG